MFDQGRLSEADYESARAEPLRVAAVTPESSGSRYFLDFVRHQLPEVYDREVLEVEGLAIYSTLEPRMQRVAVRALTHGLEKLEREHPEIAETEPERRLQGCIIAMRPQTGEVIALVGGRDYGESQYNRCTQARRPAGSTFKPFSYIAGLEPDSSGRPAITPASLLSDSPLEIETNAGLWEPNNFDLRFRGPVTVRHALQNSLNIPAIRLGQEVGVRRVAEVARRLGVTSELPLVPSLPLGTAEVAPIELARAYSTIANGGIRPSSHSFEDVVASGETLARRKLAFERVLDGGVAYLATSLLQGVIDHGTGKRVRKSGLRGPIGGKTGTTDDEHDLWFVGFTPELVVVVWVGFDEPRPVGVQSSWGALPIWVNFMLDAVGPNVRGAFLRPPSVRESEINPETGALAMAGCPVRATEYFLRGTEPTEICSARFAFGGNDDARGDSGAGPDGRRERKPEQKRSFWDRLFGR
jgi:penicillin-binding protein 1B